MAEETDRVKLLKSNQICERLGEGTYKLKKLRRAFLRARLSNNKIRTYTKFLWQRDDKRSGRTGKIIT